MHVEIDAARLRENARAILSVLRRSSRSYFMVKGDGYGHRIDTVVPALATAGPTAWGTHSVDEAAQVRALRPHDVILVMDAVSETELRQASALGARVALGDMDTVRRWAALPAGARPHAELQIDVGLQRTGVRPAEIGAARELLAAHPAEVHGAFAHVADYTDAMGTAQIADFARLAATVRGHLGDHVGIHLASSRGLTVDHRLEFGGARVGRSLFGVSEGLIDPAVAAGVSPVMSIDAEVVGSRPLLDGSNVGYAGWSPSTYPRDSSVFTMRIGYFEVPSLPALATRWQFDVGGRTATLVDVGMQYSIAVVPGPGPQAGERVRLIDCHTPAGHGLMSRRTHGIMPQHISTAAAKQAETWSVT